jgi:hypothetical protein
VAPSENGAHCSPEAQVFAEQLRTHMVEPLGPTGWQVVPSGQEHVLAPAHVCEQKPCGCPFTRRHSWPVPHCESVVQVSPMLTPGFRLGAHTPSQTRQA